MKENKSRLILAIGSLWGASIIGIVVCGILTKAQFRELIQFGLLAVIFNAIFDYYLQLFQKKLIYEKFPWWLLSLGYVSSLILLCNPYGVSKYPIWLLGVVLIAVYVDMNLSLIMTYSILFMAISLSLYEVNEIIIPFVLGTFLCLTAKFLKNATHLFYLTILVVSMNVTLLFVINGFDGSQVLTTENYTLLAVDFILIVAIFAMMKILPIQESRSLTTSMSETAAADTQEMASNDVLESQKQLEAMKAKELEQQQQKLKDELILAVSADAVLLKQLQQESDKLYHHSKLVATISKRAADYIHADANLACAGGWYHEIGRLKGKDYVNCGVELIEENHLPKEIGELIREHNYKIEKPHSLEAMIVMLTDNIVSTMTYLNNNKDTNISPEKVVENTFSVLMNKGTFNETKIEVSNFLKLKEFYLGMINELKEKKEEA